MNKINGIYDEHARNATIYINQRAYCNYVLWRCCFYQERVDFPTLCCSVAEIYATYYKIAQTFDLVVEPIYPKHVLDFLRGFEHDGIMRIVEKQRGNVDEKNFVPCCVISPKWGFWYQGIISDSISEGCKDIVLRHSDRMVVPIGKSIVQLNTEDIRSISKDTLGRKHNSILYSKRMGDRTKSNYSKNSGYIHDIVIYDDTPEDIIKHDEDEEESFEESAFINHMHHSVSEQKPPTQGKQDVYQYIKQLRSGQMKPMISHHASSSMKQLDKEYLEKSEALDRERKRRAIKLRKAMKKDHTDAKENPRGQSAMHTMIVSKHIAWIHLRLQEVSIIQDIEITVSETPEISEYLSICPTLKKENEDECVSTSKNVSKTKKRKQKKIKKKKSRKTKQRKKRDTKQNTAICEQFDIHK